MLLCSGLHLPIKSVGSDKLITDSTSYNLTSKTVYIYYDSSATAAIR